VSSSSSPLLATHANCLPVGTRVADFEIIGLIGEGGFGIVYLAKDTSLDRIVALKEFMPASFAGRIDGIHVAVRAANHKATFDAGLKSFINEAKMLAKFAHPALVEVFRFWEGNGTAYMAMRLYRGETLRQTLTKGEEPFTEERIAQIMGPIFDALEMLHREQVFHRDIAPDNIMLSDGRSVLLDFGSARKIIGDATQALTTVLKPGYAPIEQYSDDGTMKQGAWTDVYALGGVLYHLATGKSPLQAVSRMMSDPLQTVAQVTGDKYSANFSQAVSKAMSVHVDNRFQTVTEFREALGWNVGLQPRVVTLPSNAPQVWLEPEVAPRTGPAAAAVASATTAPVTGNPATKPVIEPVVRGERVMERHAQPAKSNTGMLAVAAVAVLLVAGGGYWWSTRPATGTSATAPAASETKPIPPVANTTPASELPVPKAATDVPPAADSGVVAEGIVKFDIKPPSRIDINGLARGISSKLAEVKLPVGKHTIDIINPPAATVTRTIEVKQDTPITVSHTFK
jgi:serine/threonine protein kinase